jgi:hypothetical protein
MKRHEVKRTIKKVIKGNEDEAYDLSTHEPVGRRFVNPDVRHNWDADDGRPSPRPASGNRPNRRRRRAHTLSANEMKQISEQIKERSSL